MNVVAGRSFRHSTRGYLATPYAIGADLVLFDVRDPKDGFRNRTATSARYFAANYEPA
jgi:hypothetical protein